jgi:hypothetical protein
MEIQGVKGFKDVKRDPKMMGVYILENLLGLDQVKKLSKQELREYMTETYPKVMAFFLSNDLQPTLMNLRKNLTAIKDFVENYKELPATPAPAADLFAVNGPTVVTSSTAITPEPAPAPRIVAPMSKPAETPRLARKAAERKAAPSPASEIVQFVGPQDVPVRKPLYSFQEAGQLLTFLTILLLIYIIIE